MKWISVCGIGVVLMLAGCKTAEKSQILTAFQNAGGGEVAQATPQATNAVVQRSKGESARGLVHLGRRKNLHGE